MPKEAKTDSDVYFSSRGACFVRLRGGRERGAQAGVERRDCPPGLKAHAAPCQGTACLSGWLVPSKPLTTPAAGDNGPTCLGTYL